MKIVKVSELQSINTLIDENQRFTITHEEDDYLEEEKTKDVIDKIALLREQYLRRNK